MTIDNSFLKMPPADALTVLVTRNYCKFRNFLMHFNFPNSIKTHICNVKNSRRGHDLLISVNDRVISPINEDFIFTKLCIPNLHYIILSNSLDADQDGSSFGPDLGPHCLQRLSEEDKH